MDANRKHWNEQQKVLKQALGQKTSDAAEHARIIASCLGQHAAVHTAAVSACLAWSFEDEVWSGLCEEGARRVPDNGEHSILWMVYHITRIEDLAMNVLAVGAAQVFDLGGWGARLGVSLRDTGNSISPAGIAAMSAAMDLTALRDYRAAVGLRTREVIGRLEAADLRRKVSPAALQTLLDDGTVLPDAMGLIEYWGGLTVAGLLLMPATRHPFVHWNEALRQKPKRN